MSEVLEITQNTYDDEVVNGDTPVLLDFFTDYCGPCRKLAPVIDELAHERSGTLKIGKVNCGTQPELATRFHISSVPCLVLLKDGKETSRRLGGAPKDELLSWLDRELA